MIISESAAEILRGEVTDLWAQRAEIDRAIAGIEAILEGGPAPANVVAPTVSEGMNTVVSRRKAEKASKGPPGQRVPEPRRRRVKKAVKKATKPRGRGGPIPQYDWDKGEKMWNEKATVEEIANALGCSTSAVKNKAYTKWKRRSKSGTTNRKPTPRRDSGLGMLPNRKRIALSKCPACKAMTNVQPCEMCHKKLPASAIGKT